MYQETTQNENNIKCKVCQEEIRLGARKCIKCGSYQNWKKYLNFSDSVLSLLVALVSVLTVLIPIITNLQKISSKINLHVINTRKGQLLVSDENKNTFVVEIFATNSGKEAGVIKSFYIKTDDMEKEQDMVAKPKYKENYNSSVAPTSVVIEAEKSEIIAAHLVLEENQNKCYKKFKMAAQIISFNGSEKTIKIPEETINPSDIRLLSECD